MAIAKPILEEASVGDLCNFAIKHLYHSVEVLTEVLSRYENNNKDLADSFNDDIEAIIRIVSRLGGE